ncbi:MAG TPA: SDR family NAD(P)-dependent oxidoreductase [Steroidobacteraceae bacterium]|nr:SDR family NAD(P)-dependent oxidoreductase [Steroidobacteraceae bacterium]
MTPGQTAKPVWKDPLTILITGATGGIGAALARRYARPGRTLILHGRDSGRLGVLARECEASGAHVVSVIFDLRNAAEATRTLRTATSGRAIDLAIVSAGVTHAIGDGEEVESWEVAREVLAVNLDGAIVTIAAVLADMRRRAAGQIAIMSSLSAYYGLPITPTYCASKAALKAYGEALRGWLAPQGIGVSVVLAGFVHTGMMARFPGATPGALTAGQAALRIERGLAANSARIAFPPALAWGAWWLAVLPAALSQRLVRAFGYGA